MRQVITEERGINYSIRGEQRARAQMLEERAESRELRAGGSEERSL